MARFKRRNAIRNVSPATAARLATVLSQLGSDANRPAPAVLSSTYAKAVNTVIRPDVLAALKAMAGGTTGFDYGPVGLTVIRWVCINWLSRYANPDVIWQHIRTGKAIPAVPKGKAKAVSPVAAAPVAAPVAAPAPVVATPATAAATAAQIVEEAVAAAAPLKAEPKAGAPVKLMTGVCPAEAKHPEWNWQPAAKVFGVTGLKGRVAVWPQAHQDGAHPRTPKLDPDFEWSKETLQWAVFAAGESPAKGCWFWGQRATGKTEFTRQFAAQTGRPFYGVTFTKTMEPMDFIGADGAKGGDSAWRDGTILMGLRDPVPAVIMFDEMSYGQSSHISGPLNEIVHPLCSFTVPSTGERVDFCDGHLFIAADNTNGTGDPTGMFIGTNMINRATMDRFAFFRRFTYMPKAQEIRLLMNRTHCDEAVAERVYGVMHALRAKVDSGMLADPPSIREAMALACALRGGFNDKDAFETCFVGKYAEEAQEEMRVTFTAAVNVKD